MKGFEHVSTPRTPGNPTEGRIDWRNEEPDTNIGPEEYA